jgi:low affinity Fe/Cu permease
MREFFSRFARRIADAAGSPYAFLMAFGSVLLWAVLGPVFAYSSRWQLVINTGTTIVTFLMVFLIQNAANRDQAALQLKLDELLKAVKGARTGFANIEELTEDQIEELREQFRQLATAHDEDVADLKSD